LAQRLREQPPRGIRVILLSVAAAEPSPRKMPILAIRRLPLSAPSAASSGPPTTGAISGGLVSDFLDQAEPVGDLRDPRVEDGRSGPSRDGR
jgi:hypothetical protein